MARIAHPKVSALKDVDVIEAMRQTSLALSEVKGRVEPEGRRKRMLTMPTPVHRALTSKSNRTCCMVVCTKNKGIFKVLSKNSCEAQVGNGKD